MDEDLLRERSIDLFKFLHALVELRGKSIKTIDEYEKVIWFENIVNSNLCYNVFNFAGDERSELWLEIEQPPNSNPPVPPEATLLWINGEDFKNCLLEFPRLMEKIAIRKDVLIENADESTTALSEIQQANQLQATDDSDGSTQDSAEPINTATSNKKKYSRKTKTITEILNIDDYPEITEKWHQYVEEHWKPWAAQFKQYAPVMEQYNKLFDIYQKLQKEAENYELLLALGCLSWRTPSQQRVTRHILTARATLHFDGHRGTLSISAPTDGMRFSLEQDMLDFTERPQAAVRKQLESIVEELAEDFWNTEKIQTLLETFVRSLSAGGQYSDSMARPQSPVEDPKIHLAPAIILRARSNQHFANLFSTIINQIEDGQELPLGVQRLVSIVDDEHPDSEIEKSLSDQDDEIYFPLPANPDQKEIAQRLRTRQGILVQGPPGTGKSHTITNLVCHLLAQGKRVLVTSHTPRALSVLREKFPDDLKSLCISVVGDDSSETRKAMEDSVAGINAKHNDWSPTANKNYIGDLRKKLSDLREAEQWTFNALRSIKERDTYVHSNKFGFYSGTAQQIAMQVRAETDNFDWMPKVGVKDEPVFGTSEARELLGLFRYFTPEREAETAKIAPEMSKLLEPKEFTEKVARFKNAQEKLDTLSAVKAHESYRASTKLSKADRERLVLMLDELISTYQSIAKRPEPFAKQAAQEITGDHDRKWRDLLAVTKEGLEKIGSNYRSVLQKNVSGLQNRDFSVVRNHSQNLKFHLQSGKGLGFWQFRSKVVKEAIYLITETFVEGKPCQTPEVLDELDEFLSVHIQTESLKAHWQGVTELSSSSVMTTIASLHDFCEPLETGLTLHDKMLQIREELQSFPSLIAPHWDDLTAVKQFREVLASGAAEEDFNSVKESLSSLETELRSVANNPNSHIVAAHLLDALVALDDQKYHQFAENNCELWQDKDKLLRRDDLAEMLKKANKPLFEKLRASCDDSSWDSRFKHFEQAWRWSQCSRWIEEISDPSTFKKYTVDLEKSQNEIRKTLGELASAKSWEHTFNRLTEEQRQHLISWSMAVRRIGKGTGKHAEKHRRDARRHMDQCRTAIPAWIMPIHKVVESVRPGSDAFDVVIVDEASQSGPEALFLLYIAKQLVVVGDDKQISPEFVGLQRASVDALREQYLRNIPHSDAIGVDHSLFDQAKIRYRGKVRLKEHFRCMPEIIQFSNNLCYSSDPLIPLRQYGGGRITPVVKTNYLQNGYCDENSRRVVNIPEAEAIAHEIKRICDDPSYDGKTIGVISLLNTSKQADHIEGLLNNSEKFVTKSQLEERKIRVGDPYVFQGDERDIILLSMVSAPPSNGRKVHPMASEKDERRFNVAVSRARDQLILFHSVTLNDLSPKCVRHKLLQYCEHPHVESIGAIDADLNRLRHILAEGYRGVASLPDPFDSWFELDVFLRIADRGFRVIPQLCMNGYKIDLIVEGIRGRLAIECDGDRWHGPEKYDDDMARQRDLERCGMQFWRVRGSGFYHDPEKSLEDLWRTLERLEIMPAVASATSSGDTAANLSMLFHYASASKDSDLKVAEDDKYDFFELNYRGGH